MWDNYVLLKEAVKITTCISGNILWCGGIIYDKSSKQLSVVSVAEL